MFWALYLMNKISGITRPAITGEKCLNNRQSIISCKACELACPAGAITHGKEMVIDEDKCRGCGTCSASCPSRCIKWPNINWYRRYHEVMTTETPVLGCNKSELKPVNVFFPCVGCIGWEFISAAILGCKKNKKIYIDISECFSCSMKKSLRQLMKSVRKSSRFTGNSNVLSFIFPGSDNCELAGINSNSENLRFLGGRISDFASDVIRDIFPDKKEEDTSLRELLQASLARKENLNHKIAVWNVNENCKACGLCQGICPQRAWDFVYQEKSVSFIHNPWLCTECEACADNCQNNAKERNKQSVSMIIENNGEWISHVFDYTNCKNCSQPVIITTDKKELCNSCIKREGLLMEFKKICKGEILS